MERNFSRIARLRAQCCIRGARIRDIQDYYLQYAGLIVGGRKVIYVNAFYDRNPSDSWRTQVPMICDGGTAAWGVLYDPATRTFSQLAVNGTA